MVQTTKEKLSDNVKNHVTCCFSNVRAKLEAVVKDYRFDTFILTIILLNSFVLGAMTFPEIYLAFDRVLIGIDYICVSIFVFEICLKIYVMKNKFFKDGWNIFDFIVVALSLIPSTGAFIIIRTFRVFRVLRLFSVLPSMRRVLTMFLETLPSVFSTLFLMVIVFYVFGVMSVYLFGDELVDFSNLSLALEALFGFLTFDGWSSEKAQLAMSVYPCSWIFFMVFVAVFMLMIINVFTSAVVEGVKGIRTEKRLNKENSSSESIEEKIEILEKQHKELVDLLRDKLKK
ncbi:MAG: ion transporter [Alphaproteobacteria bacterium]